ncbi:hypothetical protein [Leptospira ryugenii]|uniref:hypothetical protein n=1 Tax=Leptospira ryugenii TaxID=1917863 RepID=UPI00107F2360|nr:hypothetical protein [Leptospira ryugenii]
MNKAIVSLVFVLLSCLSTPKQYLGVQDTNIDSKLNEIMKRETVNLLVLVPRELSSTNCSFSEEVFLGVLKQSNIQMESQLLKFHGKNTNFHLVDRDSFSYLLEEIKIQKSGLTSGQTAQIGKMSGANYIIVNSGNLNCSGDNKELIANQSSKLIKIESSITEAIDTSKLVLRYDDSKQDFIFHKGFINGRAVLYDPDRESYAWSE